MLNRKKRFRLFWRPGLFTAALGVLLTLVIESFCRRSVFGGLSMLWHTPLLFLYNAAIVTVTLSLALLFRRRGFVLALLSAVWVGLAVGNCVVKGFRPTPISAIDFRILPSVLSILDVYLTVWQMVLIGAAFVLLIVGLVVLFRKCRKRPLFYRNSLLTVGSMLVLVVALTVGLRGSGRISRTVPSLAEAYDDYGFAYCFLCSIMDTGISRPEEYSGETMTDLREELEETAGEEASGHRPNIILVQLESFFDPLRLKGVSCSEDPIPHFRALQESCPSGFLTVPSVGAGTANTEFEIMTGMSLDYFGPGEYPYRTILTERTCESVCFTLKQYGYTAHAIHNNEATFYDRNEVFPHLGYDTFTPIEYMEKTEENPIGWCKDSVLTAEIFRALHATVGKDFVYTISVQGHGRYPEEAPEVPYPISVEGMEETEKYAFEYYVNQIREMDAFLGELVGALSAQSEPVMLVLYGDHLPNFELETENLTRGTVYQTEYVIWTNYTLTAQDCDLHAYQLSAHLLSLCGMEEGLLNKLHQNRGSYTEEDYQKNLELLEYDMLYSDMAVYDGWMPYEPTRMQMGTRRVRITDTTVLDGRVYVFGEHFTPFSVIRLNGGELETEYVSSHILKAPLDGKKAVGTVTVAQIAADRTVLGESEVWEMTEE